MTCLGDNEVTALLTGVLEGEAFAAAEMHLDVCRRCRLVVSTLATKTGDTFRNGSLNAFGPDDVVAGRYQIIALLGSGGMGEVYEALDTVLGGKVALKTLAAGMAIDETGVARIKAEVQIARRVTHRNVCRVFDVGFHADDRPEGDEVPSVAIPFFTMELLPGETLRSRLRRCGPLSPVEVLALLEQIAAGLDAAHAAGIVHRDLKTENVILVPQEEDSVEARVVITDFGLAHHLDPQALCRIPLMLHAAGTLGYMAPEQLAGEQPSRATDIYALGVVLFELLTGGLPFTVAEIVASKGRCGPPPSLRSSCAAPPAWQVVIDRCLEESPAARFGSVGELLSMLRPPRRRRVLAPMSVGVAAIALVVGASVLAARRDLPFRPPTVKRDVPPLHLAARATPEAPAVLPPRAPVKVGALARGTSAVPPAPSRHGRSPWRRRLDGESSVPAKPLDEMSTRTSPLTVPPPPPSSAGPLGADDLVDPFAQP
jgi:serine/threonine protein kinase